MVISTRYLEKKFLPLLISRTVIFFFVMCLLNMILYVIGTVQDFIDSTQLSLLRLHVVLGIFLTFSSLFGIGLDLKRFIKIRKWRYFIRSFGYLALVILGAATVLAAIFIITISGGNTV